MNKRTGISSDSELVQLGFIEDDDTVGGRTNPENRLGEHRRQCFGGFYYHFLAVLPDEVCAMITNGVIKRNDVETAYINFIT
jgi:hypothetical protein